MDRIANITDAIVAMTKTIQHDFQVLKDGGTGGGEEGGGNGDPSVITNTNTNTNGTVWSLVTFPSLYGTVFTMGCLIFFGYAIHKEWNFDLAPRVANRPKAIIKSALVANYDKQNKKYNDRNNRNLNLNHHWWWLYPLAWIAWAYHLTYTECLVGISNTGTRIRKRRKHKRHHHEFHHRRGCSNTTKTTTTINNRTSTSNSDDADDADDDNSNNHDNCCRWEGPLLKTNLDAVICLRYHTLLFKLSCMICGLCTFIILPINLTATCDPTVFGVGTCYQQSNPNNTGFFKLTTITNIPDKIYNNATNVVVTTTFDPSNIVNAFHHKNLPKEDVVTTATITDVDADADDQAIPVPVVRDPASFEYNDTMTIGNNVTTRFASTYYTTHTNNATSTNVPTTMGLTTTSNNSTNSIHRSSSSSSNKSSSSSSDNRRRSVEFMSSTLWVPDQTWRIVVTLLSCIVMYIYTCYLLANEWIANVELRCQYFLEADHYYQRMTELNKLVACHSSSSSALSLLLSDEHYITANDVETAQNDDITDTNISNKTSENEDSDETSCKDYYLRRSTTHDNNYNDADDDDNEGNSIISEDLPPYLTNPEHRETPCSVGLYSVMYQLPASMVTYDTDGATPIKRQLVATTNFFDEIIPPQPGFTSSVAAATVLPNAKLVARTWNAFISCESKLRTLRYIRMLITKKNNIEEEEETDNDNNENEKQKVKENYHQEKDQGYINTNARNESSNLLSHSSIRASYKTYGNECVPSTTQVIKSDKVDITKNCVKEESSNTTETTKIESNHSSFKCLSSVKSKMSFSYNNFNIPVYAKTLGFCDELDMMSDFVEGMGIEELNVFAYHRAYVASGLGINLFILQFYTVDRLKAKENEIMLELREAQVQLQRARRNVVSDNDGDHALLGGSQSILSAVHTMDDFKNVDYDITLVTSGSNSSTNDRSVDDSIVSNNIHPQNTTYTGESILECLAFHWRRIFHETVNLTDFGQKYYGRNIDRKGKGFVTDLEHPTYAVITFTSRQSAIIARQCLADGGGRNIWKPVDGIPNYPLADSPSLMFYPRGCMRPVTPTIRYSSKKIRRWIVITTMTVFTIANVFIVQKINKFVLDPNLFSAVFGISEENATKFTSTASGLSQTMLFSICPVIFKFVAYCEGSSNSMEMAERRAMIYFWYFYLIARFMGQILWEAAVSFLTGRSSAEASINTAITDLANTVPNSLGPSALSFIISSGTISFPLFYFIQICNFGTSMKCLKYINRYLKSGGNGCEVPYRIYVDSGYIFACMIALGPLCPLVGTFGMFYFIIVVPMLRFTVVFAYRPVFEGGGDKWPKLHHIIITSLLLSQLITSVTFLLKQNIIEGLIAGCCIIPTLVFNNIIQERYLRPYRCAGLLQAGRIPSSSSTKNCRYTCNEREEYRRWLVDCHKASYVPTCLSGGTKNVLTAEPAVAIADDETAEC